MITKVMNSAIPKTLHCMKNTAAKGSGFRKFLQSESLGKVLDVAAENPAIFQSAFSLAICLLARPATNFLITKDKQDATYASCHSISSGVIGFVWPMIFATPISMAVKNIAKTPHKYLKPGIVKKFYPEAVIDDVIKDGKKVGEKIRTNLKGQMVRKDGKQLIMNTEPLMVYGDEARAAFEKAHPELLVEKTGVVRSKSVFKTEKGVLKLDKNGNKIGCAVQEDLNPITEDMEIAARKEKNIKNAINMSVDIVLAPFRAALTIATIPWIMKHVFGLEKGGSKKADATNNIDTVNLQQHNIAAKSTVFNSFKKGGV